MSARRLAALEVRNVSKIYESAGSRVTALAAGSLTLSPGTVTGIVGPSGSGKTTLLMIAGLLETPTAGEVLFDGRVISRPGSRLNDLRAFRRAHLGFVFQKANLIPFLTAADNVAIAMQLNGVGRQKAHARAGRLLAALGMGDRGANYPSQLSGGEQQRVSIARALANDPTVILADEPTAALDGGRAEMVMKVFRHLADSRQVAICVVTHDVRWIGYFDSKLELEDGRALPVRAT
ncbi:MAG: ABC transporter ATP-binding protein [Mesorhizobium sp.]|uniref:ABC transporter ATP-binding protein n=1 Tax=Mesorhizobium sp. TaxID=1871066 RepID=UPI000FE8369B|nr:ABC transporter ATP-binding protein [Mesorhizobium sp.]RWL84275.1 MAG: ABC transporter ATP-binding protein [Mesorhizobium sp.]RWL88754.1 MAG: ABC transporter ATP-binding protein [Mesorhizobium sp.]RWM03371.1 MAG: ABC transporter ATP-binding protein [Mesorhizobium sp.]RWM04875.1 MAG: ABC transporter ATP-binding protein [Mesorhizobium sp.]TIP06011.1 MAG: ABC transporter ATP-binding protein [Mesorhizobium sp.]